jgi:hypothetical protein
MADNLFPIYPHLAVEVAAEALGSMGVVEGSVGVALPNHFLLAALLPIGSAVLELFLQLVLS